MRTHASKLKQALKWPLIRFLRKLASVPEGRKAVAAILREAQFALGVGAGADTTSSGERFLFALLRSRSSPDRLLRVFDVGANQGQFLTMALGELASFRAEIHSFEPSPASFEKLRQAAPSAPEIVLNPFGLGKEEGIFQLYANHEGSSLSSLTKRDLSHFSMAFEHTEDVRISTLDKYCEEKNITEIDLLKIDVEGHDLDVIAGGKRMLSSGGVGMVTFEFGGGNIDTRTFVRDFRNFLMDCGMPYFYRLLPSGNIMRIAEYSESLEVFMNSNFLVAGKDLEK